MKDKKKEIKLNFEQEKFCQLFATDADLYGNWVQAYLEVYDVDRSKPNWYKTACASASRLLSLDKVTVRISQLLDENWFNDVEVSKQHRFLIMQNNDLWAKWRALDSYYRVNGRFNDKLELTKKIKLDSKDIEWKDFDDIKKYIEEQLR